MRRNIEERSAQVTLLELGVPEYWIVNLLDRLVEVHRELTRGPYQQLSTVPKGARLRLLAFPVVELVVDDFLR